MTEFTRGIFASCKTIIQTSSVTLAVIYTVGHIIISMMTTYYITGTTLDLAALNALVEPCINGVWFYVLLKFYKRIVNG